MRSATLAAERVSVVLDGRPVFHEVEVICEPGTVTALVGPSGSGKTTLLHCLGLLRRPSSGRVLVDGEDATGWNDARRRRFWRDHASFILQDYGVMDEESVAFNVTMQMTLLGRKAAGDRPRMLEALERTGIGGRDEEPASHLSGGEKQRLGISRAIYKGAGCLLVDEPTASLDRENRQRVVDLFRRRADEGATVVISTHDDLVIAGSDHRIDLTPTINTPHQESP